VPHVTRIPRIFIFRERTPTPEPEIKQANGDVEEDEGDDNEEDELSRGSDEPAEKKHKMGAAESQGVYKMPEFHPLEGDRLRAPEPDAPEKQEFSMEKVYSTMKFRQCFTDHISDSWRARRFSSVGRPHGSLAEGEEELERGLCQERRTIRGGHELAQKYVRTKYLVKLSINIFFFGMRAYGLHY